MPDITLDDNTDAFIWVETSPNNPNGVEVQTTNKDGGVTTAVLIAVSVSGFFNGLFGGGHAGSCGRFRDAYFDTKQQAEIEFAEFNQQAKTFLGATTVTGTQPTQFVAEYLNAIVDLDNAIDQGFDAFKGRNLLGQTMYHDRFNGWLQRNVTAPLIFFTNDYLWEWTRTAFFDRERLSFESLENQKCCLNQQAAINTLFQVTAPIAQMQQDIATNRNNLDNVRFVSIPTILAQLNSLDNFTRLQLSPMVGQNAQQISSLLSNSIPSLQNQLNVAAGRLNVIETTFARTDTLNGVRQQLEIEIGNVLQASQFGDQQLLEFLEARIRSEALSAEASLAALAEELRAEDIRLQGEIDQARNNFALEASALEARLNQRISGVEAQVTAQFGAIQQLLAQQAETLRAERTEAIGDLRVESEAARQQISDVLELRAEELRRFVQETADTQQEIALRFVQDSAAELRLEFQVGDAVLNQKIQDFDLARQQQIQEVAAQAQQNLINERNELRQADIDNAAQAQAALETLATQFAAEIERLEDAITAPAGGAIELLRAEILQVIADESERLQNQFTGDLQLLSDRHDLDIGALVQQIDANQISIFDAQQRLDQLAFDTEQQIAEIRQQDIPQLRAQIEQQLSGLQNTLEQVDVELQQGLDVLNERIQDVIFPTLGSLQTQITELWSYLTDTILPAIASNTQSIVNLDLRITQDVEPQITQNTTNITNITDIVTLDLEPRVTQNEICCSANSDLISTIINVELPDIRNAITNLSQLTIEQILANCKLIQECVQAEWQEDTEALCEFGRRAWGIMAECWLDENTPEPDDEQGLWLRMTTPEVAVVELEASFGVQPAGLYGPGITNGLAMVQAVIDGDIPIPDFGPPESIPVDDFIFVQVT